MPCADGNNNGGEGIWLRKKVGFLKRSILKDSQHLYGPCSHRSVNVTRTFQKAFRLKRDERHIDTTNKIKGCISSCPGSGRS